MLISQFFTFIVRYGNLKISDSIYGGFIYAIKDLRFEISLCLFISSYLKGLLSGTFSS